MGLTRGRDQTRTLMRHARPTSALPVGLLALVVVVPARGGGLVSPARCQQLLLPYSLPASLTAIALAAITARADSEQRVARGVEASPHAKALIRSICCHRASHSLTKIRQRDDRTDDYAFGAMMSLARPEVQKATLSDDPRQQAQIGVPSCRFNWHSYPRTTPWSCSSCRKRDRSSGYTHT